MPKILGTRFISHPPYQNFPVQVTRPDDPLMEGIEPFAIDDELYVNENVTGDIEVLLHTRWGGEAFGGHVFEETDQYEADMQRRRANPCVPGNMAADDTRELCLRRERANAETDRASAESDLTHPPRLCGTHGGIAHVRWRRARGT